MDGLIEQNLEGGDISEHVGEKKRNQLVTLKVGQIGAR